jgi:two-component system cell cycle response regulator DivK
VLIVDGDEDTRAMYALALSALGFEVVAAQDGTVAFRRASELHPDIIVTDVPTPQYDEWPFLRDLRANPCTRDIPLVAMTGYVQQSVRERTALDGFVGFFPKPCLPDELAAGLRQVLSSARRQTSRRTSGEAA